MENLPLAACDACYTRKIRCDRGNPCANCQDSRIRCHRKRQKQVRKPRDVDLEHAIQEIKASVSNVENSVGHLLSTNPNSSIQDPKTAGNRQTSLTPTSDSGRYGAESYHRKRTSATAFETDSLSGLLVDRTHTIKRASSPRTPIEKPYSPPVFSTSEAQTLILRELANGASLSAEKKAVFQSALSSLNQSLKRPQDDTGDGHSPAGQQDLLNDLLQNPAVPPASLIQWILQETGSHSFSIPNKFPLISRQTLFRMSRSLLDSENPGDDVSSLVCVNSCASYFLHDHVICTSNIDPGDPLRQEAERYFLTACAIIPHLSLLGPPSLSNLQALQFGSINAQESGDIEGAWRLTSAACTICYALDLHKQNNPFTGDRVDEAIEAFTCFGFTYMQDKGLAMNLGRPACLQDTYIEEGVFERSIEEKEDRPTLFYPFLNLARVQSRIITDLHSAARSSLVDVNAVVGDILSTMEKIWQSMQEFRKKPLNMSTKLDIDLDLGMYDFAFHSIKTVLLHSGSEKSRNPKLAEACISSARAGFAEVQHMRELCKESKLSIEEVTTLGNWSILYYPFTPFFVLFCNVISNGHQGDLVVMEQFVDYLSEVKDDSPPVGKLHKLCVPFLNLATNMLESADNNLPPEPRTSTSSTNKAKNTIPGTNSFSTFTHTVPQLSIPNRLPTIPDSVIQDGNMHPGFPAFTSAPSDGVFWQLMDAQPRLQWLDSDFSGFEQAWGDAGFGDPSFMD